MASVFKFPGKTSREGLSELHSRAVRPRLHRSFVELQQSSAQLAQGDLGVGNDGNASGFVVRPRLADGLEAAHYVLAPKQFDLQTQNREILNLNDRLQTSSEQAHSETFRPTEIDELLQNFHERITWKKLIYSSWDRAETDVQTMYQRWAAEDWVNARQQFMESLGHRTQKWNPESAPHASISGSVVDTLMPTSASQRSEASSTTTRQYFGEKMSSMAERHAKVVRESALARDQGPTSLARDLTEVISKSIDERWVAQQDSFEDSMNQQELIGYKDSMKMMSEIVGETMDRISCPGAGTFSSICFQEIDVGPTLRQVRSQLTMGAKRHLEKQKYEEWSAEIDEAVIQGRLRFAEAGPSESRQQRIRSFVGFSFHLGNFAVPKDTAFSPKYASISETIKVKVPVWALLYHYLRVGELEGAKLEIARCRVDGLVIDDSISVCIESMERLVQPNSPPHSALERQALYESMYRCQVLFQEEFDKPSSDPLSPHARDPYKALVLNLLSIGADQEAMSELLAAVLGSSFQIEDFLWGSLWFVTWSNVALLEEHIAQGVNITGLSNLRSKGSVFSVAFFLPIHRPTKS